MPRALATLALVLAPAAAVAQPGASPAPAPAPPPSAPPAPPAAPAAGCHVDLVRVPDAMRAVIEDWVRAEPRCTTVLTVRVIPTDGGLYLLATDPAGGVRERVVPDVTTAAVLVASWAADDGALSVAAAPAPPATAPPPAAAPSALPAPATVAPSTPTAPLPTPAPNWAAPGGPGNVAPLGAAPTRVDGTARPQRSGHLLAVAGVAHLDGLGIRVGVDLYRLWRIELGGVAGWTHTENASHYRDLALDDVMVGAQAAYAYHRGRVELRGAVAAGAGLTSGTHMQGSGAAQSMVAPFADVAVTAGYRVAGRFEVQLGGAVTVLGQRINNGQYYWDRTTVPQLLLGVGYRSR